MQPQALLTNGLTQVKLNLTEHLRDQLLREPTYQELNHRIGQVTGASHA